MDSLIKISRWICFVLLVASGITHAAETSPLKKAIDQKLETVKAAQSSQKKVDVFADQSRELLYEYRNTLQRTESLKTYNNQLEKLVNKQKESLASIYRQLGHVKETQQNIVPLMLRMIDTLDEFVALDSPFLMEERKQRVALLKELMDRPDVSLPDKYRRIMESYQIELEYGRTIETYTETIQVNGKNQTVNILRVGRLLLLYQTLDAKSSGIWDKEKRIWVSLSDEYNRSIAEGIKIADKQAPPDLFKLPVPAPEVQK